MPIPNAYGGGEQPLVNFSATDISTGISRTDLFVGTASGSAVASGVLSNTIFSGNDAIRTILHGPSNRMNFDMSFKLPQTIDGDVIIQMPIYHGAAAEAGGILYAHTGFDKINKDGSTLHITSGASSTWIHPAPYASGGIMTSTVYDFPSTDFKDKEKLRFYVFLVADTNPVGFGADPNNRTPETGWGTMNYNETKTVLQIPFKVNL